jgi:hypothetical protein
MKLHIFNPGHDIALAANDEKMTAPHAVRQMQMDLGFIPALWADNSEVHMCAPDYGEDGCLPDCGPNE